MKTLLLGVFLVTVNTASATCPKISTCMPHFGAPATVMIDGNAAANPDCVEICADGGKHQITWVPENKGDQWEVTMLFPGVCDNGQQQFDNKSDTCIVTACPPDEACAIHPVGRDYARFKYQIVNYTTLKSADPEIVIDGGTPPPVVLIRLTTAQLPMDSIPATRIRKSSPGATVTWLPPASSWSVHFEDSPCKNGADFSLDGTRACIIKACPKSGECPLHLNNPYTLTVGDHVIHSSLIIEGGRAGR